MMFTYPFEILKKRLTDTVAELREIDWYLEQDSTTDKNASLKAMPAAYLQFMPLETIDLGTRIQQAIVQFDLILLSDCVYDTGSKRMKKDSPSDHMRLFDKVYKNISGFSARLSYLPEFAVLLNTEGDMRVMNTISRMAIVPPHVPRKAIMKSVQRFTCVVWDHGAFPTWTLADPQPALEVEGELELPVVEGSFDETFDTTFE